MTKIEDKDKSLIEGVLKGDHKSFAKLMEKYTDRVFRYTYSRIGDYEEAMDLTQDIFLAVFESIKNFRGESKFSTWLYSVTANYCRNYRKKKRLFKIPLFQKFDDEEREFEIADNRQNIEEKVILDDKLEKVREELSKIPEDYRVVLELREIEGYTYDEISEILNLSLSNVKVRIHRGREMLKRRLSQEGIV